MDELAERVERATGPDRELDAAIAEAIGLMPEGATRCKGGWIDNGLPKSAPKYTASLDAAMTLVPEGYRLAISETPIDDLLPWEVVLRQKDAGFGRGKSAIANSKLLSLALCAAALRARAHKEPAHG